jgi:hypothetical protein
MTQRPTKPAQIPLLNPARHQHQHDQPCHLFSAINLFVLEGQGGEMLLVGFGQGQEQGGEILGCQG